MNNTAATRKRVGPLLIIGILLLPFIFAWSLLRRGYSSGARIISFAWMAIVLAAYAASIQPRTTSQALPSVAAEASETASGAAVQTVMFVTAIEAEEKDAPNGATVNRIYRGQRVEISDTQGDWVRVTKDGFDPRWVRIADLSKDPPAELPQPKLASELEDPRLGAIPKIGEYGHNEADVIALRTAALELLSSGQCTRIEDANKSVNVAGVYYVNCGEVSNRFFRVKNGKPSFCSGSASTC